MAKRQMMIRIEDKDREGWQRLAATASGHLQVVVSKARKHTVLVCAACSLALPIQH